MRSKASIQGHPIHPMLVGFPIALWVAGFIFDLLGARGSKCRTLGGRILFGDWRLRGSSIGCRGRSG